MQEMGRRRSHPRGQQKTSESPVRSKRVVSESCFEHNTSDEIVKYMSKLPGYLQGEESNVLNVGVLDWGRLEKWKKHVRREKRCGKRGTKVSSTTTTTLGTVPNGSSHQYHHHRHRCKIDDQVHASSLLGKVKEASRCPLQHSSHPLTSTASRDSSLLYKQDIVATRKDRRSTSGLLPEMGNSLGSLGAKGNLPVRGDKEESEKRTHAQEETRESASNKLDGEEKTVVDSNAGFTCEKQEEEEEVSNIVLLRSRKQSRSTLLLSGEPHMPSSLDDSLKVTSRSLHFPDGIGSSLGLRTQVSRSCPLSFDLERDSEDIMLPLSCKKERSGGTTSHSKTASRRIFDQEKKKKRDPSSPRSKRFSFSFGRLSTSFTFKEDSSSPADDTTIKSDSKRCDGPSSQSSNPEEKHCGGSRVSPLRRLLKKSIGSENVLPSKEKSTSSFNPKPTNMDEKKKKQDTSALFQLTTRNGIPLFQFVVGDDNLNNNSRSILGATMKSSSASSFKDDDDSVQYCTFYSVNEVKKKRSGSWRLIHGHREKQQQQQQHRFAYNVIGQMRLCNSSMSSEDITEQKSENVSSVIREAVLVDETEQAKGRKELAAVVVIKKKHAEETTVIIPGGVHSFPEKGAPTPLVSRWRSGGLCDCGGWDVGCKLHVLSNKTLLHELDQSFIKLFAQEEENGQDSGPVLAMTELKTGIFRVEFGSFLSHLQAFFVCVTVITCASEEEEEEKTVSKTTGRSSSPFAPPLSPVGRV